MLNSALLVRLLVALESAVPVNDFQLDGVSLWPVARMALTWRLQDNTRPAGDPQDPLAWLHQAIEREFAALPPLDSRFPVRRKASLLPAPDALPADGRRSGVLFASLAEHHSVRTDGGHFHPILDPWMQEAGQNGHRAAKIELLQDSFSLDRQPRPFPALLVPLNQIRVELSPDENAVIQSLAQACTSWMWQRLGLDISGLAEHIVQQYAYTASLSRLWGRYLDQLHPDALFLNCWYALQMMALIRAARERGIQTVDVQHGVNSGVHSGYSHWTQIPPEGTPWLPDVFLVWGEQPGRNIERWLPETGSGSVVQKPSWPHRVLTGGRQDLARDSSETTQKPLQNLLHQMTAMAAKVILYTAQSIDGTCLPDLLLDVMKQAPADWLWLIRSHPRSEHAGLTSMTPEAIQARMASHGIENYECIASTRLPLGNVLRLSHHHITGYSSSVLEAGGMGVPSTCIHPLAQTYYGEMLSSGQLRYESSAASILEAIQSGAASLPGLAEARRNVVIDPAVAQAALADILAGNQAQGHSRLRGKTDVR